MAFGETKTAYLAYSDGLTTLMAFSSNREPWWKRFEENRSRDGVPVARSRGGSCTEYGLKMESVIVAISGPVSDPELEAVVRSLILEDP
jgi:hypothetical protein